MADELWFTTRRREEEDQQSYWRCQCQTGSRPSDIKTNQQIMHEMGNCHVTYGLPSAFGSGTGQTNK